MQNINWAKLTAQGRAKAPGIPWTQEELDAIHKKGMTPNEVRNGLLDPKDRGKKEVQTKEQLVKKANEIGLDFDAEVVGIDALKNLIAQAEEKQTFDYDEMTWSELRSLASEKELYKVGMKKEDVINALKKVE